MQGLVFKKNHGNLGGGGWLFFLFHFLLGVFWFIFLGVVFFLIARDQRPLLQLLLSAGSPVTIQRSQGSVIREYS